MFAQDRWSALKIAQAKSLRQLLLETLAPATSARRITYLGPEYMAHAEINSPDSRSLAKESDAEGATPLPQDATALIPNISNPPTFSDISGHWGGIRHYRNGGLVSSRDSSER